MIATTKRPPDGNLRERACATCNASWMGSPGDSCPKCGESKQCTCNYCGALLYLEEKRSGAMP